MQAPPENFCDNTTAPSQLATANLPCDAWHHYYHYQSSAQYLWLAEAFAAQERFGEAIRAYEKSLFQDHFNAEASEGKKRAQRQAYEAASLTYDKHPQLDTAFCLSVGQPATEASRLHDSMAAIYMERGFALLMSMPYDTAHSNSRFLRGKALVNMLMHREATEELAEAVRLSHIGHDAYHRMASEEHRSRGMVFLRQGAIELAIADFTKALDLNGKNRSALAARAEAYRVKGSVRLALLDEEKARLTA